MTYLGGGFGRRYFTDFIVQAALLARETDGAPVQLLWPREQDMAHDYYRPTYLCRCKAGFDAQGKLVAPFRRKHATSRAYFIVRAAQAARRPEAQAFADWLHAEAREATVEPVEAKVPLPRRRKASARKKK